MSELLELSQLTRREAEALLVRHGRRQQAPDSVLKIGAAERSPLSFIRKPHIVTLEVMLKKGSKDVRTNIFASSTDPRRARWIVVAPEKCIEKFVLPRKGQAQIFEDWGLRDRLDHPRPDNLHNITDPNVIYGFKKILGALS